MLLKLVNINKSYPSGTAGTMKQVLRNISLELKERESISIMGPSGSGKSTLLNIIGTLDSPDSGEVIFKDQKINGYSDKELSHFRNREIGFIFQSHHLLPQCTVLENVLIPTLPFKNDDNQDVNLSKALELIKEVDLWEEKDNFPGTLSGGECQRVAVIRALINNPKLLLADEPTGSLDHENAITTTTLLLKLNHEFNTSLIVVTHSEEVGAQMDKSYKLVNGKLEALK